MLLFLITLISSRFPLQRSSMVPLGAIIVAVLCMATSCPNDDEIEIAHHFEENVELLPAKKTYAIGDTIWVSYDNPSRKLFDKGTFQMIIADSAYMQSAVNYGCVECARAYIGMPLCEFVLPPGMNATPGNSEKIQSIYLGIGCPPGNLKFTVGIIPRLKGVFAISLGNGYVSDCPNTTKEFPYSELNFIFNLADCNKDVYLTLPPHRRTEREEKAFDEKRSFIFFVQ